MICTAVGTNVRQQLKYDKWTLLITHFSEKEKSVENISDALHAQLIHLGSTIDRKKTLSRLIASTGVTKQSLALIAMEKLVRFLKLFFVDIRIRRGLQPLERKSFYLDIKNHAIAAKLEAQIRELGGVSYISSPACVRCCVRVALQPVTHVSRFVSSRLSICRSVLVYFGRVCEPLSHFLHLSLSLFSPLSLPLVPLSPSRLLLFPPFSITMPTAAST